MKVFEILKEADGTFNISNDDMEIVFQAMKNQPELHVRDIKGVAEEIMDETAYSRNVGSAKFVIQRMHVILHGMAPHGVTERTAEAWMTPAKPLLKFMASKGFEPEERIRQARINLKGRKPQITYDQAKQMMADEAKNIDSATVRILVPKKNEIMSDIMAGLTARESFNRHLAQ